MPKYLCPILTCNREFTGSVDDIIPPAVGHAQGSHNINLTEKEIIYQIQKQANPNYKKEKITVGISGGGSNGLSHSVMPPISTSISKPINLRKVRSNLKTTEEDKVKWWKEMEKK